MGHKRGFQRQKILMKRIIFPWMKNVLRAYATLHVEKEKVSHVLSCACNRILNYPLPYYFISILCFFIMEFVLPLWCGKFSRFSKLKLGSAQALVIKLQNTQTYFGRLVLILCKAPVLLSIDSEGQDRAL